MALPSHALGKVNVFADTWDYSRSPAVHAIGHVRIVSDSVLIEAEDVIIHIDQDGGMDFTGETHLKRLPSKTH